MIDQGEDAQGQRWQTSQTFQSLQAVLEHVPEPALVILGPPGSGKSTLLRHYELNSAKAALEALNSGADAGKLPMTFFLPLNSYEPPLPAPKDWLAKQWQERAPDLPVLETLLRQGRMTLLLDALNEMPASRVEATKVWRNFLQELDANFRGNRLIFSCRFLDYSEELSSKDLRVPQVRIESLSDEKVQEFIEVYCPEHSATLWGNLKDTPQLKLFYSPYFLELLILVVKQTKSGEVPKGRAALFTGFVREVLWRERDNLLFKAGELLHKWDIRQIKGRNWETPFELPEEGALIPKLSQLAYQMQSQRTAGEGGQVVIGYKDALAILDHARDEDILDAGGSLGILNDEGLAVRKKVVYVHQLLQEYFAARKLAQAPQPELVRTAWRADQVTPCLEDKLAELADSTPFRPLLGTGWEETTLLAAAMAKDPARFVADLMENTLPLAGRCASQAEVSVSGELKNKLCWALVGRTQDPSADLRARINAGLALGELGDPRFERRQGPQGEYLLPPLVEIPGGVYSIGSAEGLYEDEAPMHPVKLKPFKMGKFPVTNGEWASFMKAGGYDDASWWDTEEAQAWRRGEGTAEGPKQQWRENRKRLQDNYQRLEELKRFTSEEIKAYRSYAEMTDEEFEALLEAWYPPGRQTQPGYWNDDAFNNPGQPVVGVCWHEARAYCAWLSAQIGLPFRLPTEAEREAAARGQRSRRYAYGKDFDASCCNTFETHIRRTTPIGVFPGGETPEGLVDMTGNIWDWTSSLYQSYRYDAGDGRERITGDGRRVVRGGSWNNDRGAARATCRYRGRPVNRDDGIGFRVVCSSPII